jgi:hypothetical protein
MVIPTWAEYNEKRYGHNDPEGNEDTFGRANKMIWGNLTAYATAPATGTGEHDRDGAHMSDLVSGLWVPEEGNYQGNGADDRNISLSDTGLDIKLLRIWAPPLYSFFRSEDMAGDNTSSTENVVFASDQIQSIGTGTFQVGTLLNVNLTVYYYIAYGVT